MTTLCDTLLPPPISAAAKAIVRHLYGASRDSSPGRRPWAQARQANPNVCYPPVPNSLQNCPCSPSGTPVPCVRENWSLRCLGNPADSTPYAKVGRIDRGKVGMILRAEDPVHLDRTACQGSCKTCRRKRGNAIVHFRQHGATAAHLLHEPAPHGAGENELCAAYP